MGTDWESLRCWQAVDLHEQLLPEMSPMGPGGLGMVYLDARGRPFMEVRPASRAYGFAFGYGLIQPLVDRVLLDGLGRFDGVEVRFGHRVDSVEEYARGVLVRGRRIDDRPFVLSASYVVACDGGRSGVRRQLGISMRGGSDRQRWLVLDTLETARDDARPRDVEIFCDPERPSVSVPRLHGHRRFEFRQRAGESEAWLESPETIRRLLARHTDPDRLEILRKATHAFSARVAERFRAGRVLLAGDAAHVTPPYAAQGLACGIRDVFNLAWKLALVVRGGASDGLLDSYETERRAHDRASVQLAVRLGWLMTPRSPRRAAAVQGVIRSLQRIPRVRRFVREGGPRPDGRYRRGFVLRRRGTLSGRQLPQPTVLDARGARVPLDAVLGTGFALVGMGLDPARWIAPDLRARWRERGTRFVSLLAPGDAGARCDLGARSGGTLAVCVEDGAFGGRWQRAWGRCLLVRPDRFVAVDVPPEEAARALQAPEAQLLDGLAA